MLVISLWLDQHPIIGFLLIVSVCIPIALLFRVLLWIDTSIKWKPSDEDLREWVDFQITPRGILTIYDREAPRRIYNRLLRDKWRYESYYAKRNLDFPPSIEAEFKDLIISPHTNMPYPNLAHKYGTRVWGLYKTLRLRDVVAQRHGTDWRIFEEPSKSSLD